MLEAGTFSPVKTEKLAVTLTRQWEGKRRPFHRRYVSRERPTNAAMPSAIAWAIFS